MNLKRIAAMLMAVVMLLTMLAACGQVPEEPVSGPLNTIDPSVTDNIPDNTVTPETTPEVTTTPEPVTTPEVTTGAPETGVTTSPTTTAAPATTTKKADKNDYTVESLSGTMYATISLNVRSGPSTDFSRLGALAEGEEVTVTGRASTGWYQIDYKGQTGYVSNIYMSSEKPAVTAATTKPANNNAGGGNAENLDDEPGGNTTPSTPSTGGNVTSGAVTTGSWVKENGVEYMYGLFNSDNYKNAINKLGIAVQEMLPSVSLGEYLTHEECIEYAENLAQMAGTGYCYFDQVSRISGTTLYLRYYVDTPEQAQSMMTKMENTANKVVNAASGYSDYNKIKYLYEWLTKNAVYDGSGSHFASSYGSIVDGKANCMGFAKGMFYLLSKAGYDVVYEVGFGTEDEHIWVKVRMGGKWYCIDPGWANNMGAESKDTSHVDYGFLLVSDSFIARTRLAVYDLTKYYSMPSASSDDYSWYRVNNCYATSMSEAESILKAQAKSAINNAGNSTYIYVRIQFSTKDLFSEALDYYNASNFAKDILSGISSDYKVDNRLRYGPDNPVATRSIEFRLVRK